ncbi:hypothetical protein BC937DRAFT_86752, partial [Endogone sp. FLAS-F59071]
MNCTDTETVADKLTKEVKSLTKTLQSLCRELLLLELNQININQEVRRLLWDLGSGDYIAKWLKIINLEKALIRAKSSLHSMNIALRVKHTTVAAATNAVTDISVMYLLPIILEHHLSGRKVVFTGTDLNIVITFTTISRTLEEVFADINCFYILSTEDSSNVETTLYSDGVQ